MELPLSSSEFPNVWRACRARIVRDDRFNSAFGRGAFYPKVLVLQSMPLVRTGGNGSKETIDGGRVNVPTNFWKVIVLLRAGKTIFAA